MIILKADNRTLAQSAKFASLLENTIAGVGSIRVNNLEPFHVGDPIFLSEFGQFDAEVLKVQSIDAVTNSITLGDMFNVSANTVYAHAESTKITVLPFDQIRFFWTLATGTLADENPVFDENTPLTPWEALDPTNFYSSYIDVDNNTGFGWFMFKNAITDDVSQQSNPIPYAGFTGNTAQQVISDFQSLLNTNELKLVTYNDMLSWLNEAVAMYKNRLNLTNVEFTVSDIRTINLIAGTAEYLLPNDFSDLVEITDDTFRPISAISVSDDLARRGNYLGSTVYYLRGRYIGFNPIPGVGGVIYYRYRANATTITSLSTYITLPDNAFYSLKDWMMYRAYMKFNNPNAATYYQGFKNAVDMYIMASIKRNADHDTWGIESYANS